MPDKSYRAFFENDSAYSKQPKVSIYLGYIIFSNRFMGEFFIPLNCLIDTDQKVTLLIKVIDIWWILINLVGRSHERESCGSPLRPRPQKSTRTNPRIIRCSK